MGEHKSDRPTMPAPISAPPTRRRGERDNDATRPHVVPEKPLGKIEPRRRPSQPLVEIPPPATDDPRRR